MSNLGRLNGCLKDHGSVAGDTWKRFSCLNETVTMPSQVVPVKLIGVLGSAAGNREIMLPAPNALAVQELISMLLKTVGNTFFRDLLVDAGTEDPRPNVIILLNDQDCNIFDGLRTQIEPGTKVTIIPVAHGG
ncbi:MoaD/ThiS family protein [Candidatus Bathyarchaeota archaeon]|nr:MAG: MoaD/ThiS family protein [Candidatus Bathyarchaeota archaeon]